MPITATRSPDWAARELAAPVVGVVEGEDEAEVGVSGVVVKPGYVLGTDAVG